MSKRNDEKRVVAVERVKERQAKRKSKRVKEERMEGRAKDLSAD